MLWGNYVNHSKHRNNNEIKNNMENMVEIKCNNISLKCPLVWRIGDLYGFKPVKMKCKIKKITMYYSHLK